jgi:acyl transferase domain-containing protein
MRVVVVCPGRGSFTRESQGSLLATPSVVAADAMRRALGRPTPTEMDRAPYTSALHVAGEHASILTAAASLADRDQLRGCDVVAVIGNSMGWYTALVVAGALSLDDGLKLIETMGSYQAGNVIGGQVLYPLVDAEWRAAPSPEVDALLASTPDLHWSIRLGGQAVLGGSAAASATAMRALPPRKVGARDAPMQLPLHSAFHTPLMAEASARAQRDLADLRFTAPAVPLVDGRGVVYRPRHADARALHAYTLGEQVTAPYDFTASVRVALREYAPDALVLLGPGGTLGGPVAQAMIAEGWRGLRAKSDFDAVQAGPAPIVLDMARQAQRERVT